MNLGAPSFRSCPRDPSIRTIAIIGAGFSGTLVAINLLKLPQARPLRILLIDRKEFGRGVAYASRGYQYLLNLPVGRMSANSDDPLEFLRFLQHHLPLATIDSFVPREAYGDYLRGNLARAEANSPRVELLRIHGSASGIERTPCSFRIRFADGRTHTASAIVLALGNPPPAQIPAAESVRGSSRYVEDPWAVPLAFRPGEAVLIAGTGLTMVDIALAGHRTADGRARIYAISPHGLISAPQVNFRESDEQADELSPLITTPLKSRHLFRLARALCDDAVVRGGDWRAMISRLCAMAPELWHDLPECERRRFLRHIRAYWDVHRQRLPLRAWNAIKELRDSGTLHVHAGRLIAMQIARKQIRVRWRPRGEQSEKILLVDRLINCTGPDYDLRNTRSPLWHSLFARGLAVPDPLGLGVLTGEFGALRGADGHRAPDLYYVGPMLRADHWEAITVRELRVHAERLARHLAPLHADRETVNRDIPAFVREDRT